MNHIFLESAETPITSGPSVVSPRGFSDRPMADFARTGPETGMGFSNLHSILKKMQYNQHILEPKSAEMAFGIRGFGQFRAPADEAVIDAHEKNADLSDR